MPRSRSSRCLTEEEVQRRARKNALWKDLPPVQQEQQGDEDSLELQDALTSRELRERMEFGGVAAPCALTVKIEEEEAQLASQYD